jgi:asparagine synthase (glutamine-hydrolysing)
MAATLVHRGPDDEGVWVDPAAGIALAFRRLAILDLSPTGHQPMHSADGRFSVVFNGEIYNFADLRNELAASGAQFRGHSDTEVLLAAASRWGPEAALFRLWGMFAIALWDHRECALMIARDRLGKKPLYYGEFGRTWIFGSELKAMQAHPDCERRVDRGALSAFLRLGYVPAPHSIFRRISKLAPGTVAWLRPGEEARPRRYWDAGEVARGGLASRVSMSAREAVDESERLLRDAVGRRMVADVPLGAFLSGGVDSSAVVALMQAQSATPVRTFTIGFDEEGYDEAKAARAVAQHLATAHTELYVTADQARDVIPRLPVIYDEPFADSSQIPTCLVSALARRSVTVALSGDGGDEVFAGYTRYAWAQSIWSRLEHVPRLLRRPLAAAIGAVPPQAYDGAYRLLAGLLPDEWRQAHAGDKLHKLAALLSAGSADALYLGLVSTWFDPAAVTGTRERESRLGDVRLTEGVPSLLERMMLWDLATYLPDDILTKVDRASMAVSLEARSPLLDHRLVEWSWRLPAEFKQRDGVSKWVLRQVLYRYVPSELVERPKMGFGVPIGVWLRGPLREWAEALLDERRLASEGYFDPRVVRRVWRNHLRGTRNEQYRLWAVLTFQSWLESITRC